MPFEVENKFAVSDPQRLEQSIRSLGWQFCGLESQTDSYFSHPQRDFAATDEALRVRAADGAVHITFKGPRAEGLVKIREEIELTIAAASDAAERAIALLDRLGFRLLACVRKRRSYYRRHEDPRPVVICLDEVDGLGTFVEIELLAESTQLPDATRRIEELQQQLQLGDPIRLSYLRMILAGRSGSAGRRFSGDA